MESQIKQLALGSRPWTEKVREVLLDKETGMSRKEIRPKDLAEIMKISIPKATVELSKLEEYQRVALERGCSIYILVG